jgi:hypothetical protein
MFPFFFSFSFISQNLELKKLVNQNANGQKKEKKAPTKVDGGSSKIENYFLKFLLFICAYNVWVISPPFPAAPAVPAPPAPGPLSPRYQTETILPLSLILLKRECKQ